MSMIDNDELRARVAELEAENGKLRGLVVDMMPCYKWSDCLEGCTAEGTGRCRHPRRVEERARELGVEA